MKILMQKHRNCPIWKFYDDNNGKRSYLGQILGNTKGGMPALAIDISKILLGKENPKYKKEELDDKSLNIYDIKTSKIIKRVAGFEKEFEAIGKFIKDNSK